MNPTVCLVFKNTVALGCDPQQLVRCLQSYTDQFVGPAWGCGCVVRSGTPEPWHWPVYVLDDADQAGVLGYHGDPGGLPSGYVFVKTAAREGDPTSVVASHELAELLVDPGANQYALSPRGRFVALEIADPVEGLTFDCEGLPVSDFATPAWFGGPGPHVEGLGVSYDHLWKVSEPWRVMPGGYALVIDDDTGAVDRLFGSPAARGAYGGSDRRLRRSDRRSRYAAGTAWRASFPGKVTA